MIHDADFARIVGSIYDGALDGRLWPQVLEQIADALGAGPAAVLFQDQVTKLGTGATARLDPAALADYFGYYADRNPLTRDNDITRFDPSLSHVALDGEIISKSALVATEFYTDYYRPNGMHSALMIAAGTHGTNLATFNFMRSERQPDFDTDDVRLATAIEPHLARAFRLAIRLAETGRVHDTLLELMERSLQGLFLVDAAGRVLRANHAGLALLGDGLDITHGEIVATARDTTHALRRLIGAAGGRTGEPPAGGALTVPRPSLLRSFAVIVAPLGGDAAEVFGTGPAALVSVSDLEATGAPPAGLLVQLFKLTPAEIRVAERLLQGETPELAAATLSIKVSTARSHLASLYRKTSTSRQVELVRLLLSLAR